MQYTRLGSTGLEVSRICLGMMTYGTPQWREWVIDEATSLPLIKHAVEQGINFFDTADMYSAGHSEMITGNALRQIGKRDDFVIATKVFFPVELAFKGGVGNSTQQAPNNQGLSRKRIMKCVDDSLRRLNTDYIDLYQIHRWDYNTPIEETMIALHDVVKAGKARYIGASSMFAWQFAKAQQFARSNGLTPFVTMQNHYNLVYREEEREMIPLCKDQGVGLLPWSPLARGFLAGNRKADDAQAGATSRAKTDTIAQNYYYRDADFAVLQALTQVAQARGVSNARVAYAWLLHQGVTAPIIGASKVTQLDEACAAVDLGLSADELAALQAPYTARAVVGHN